MCVGLLFVTESPRWLASKGRTQQALNALAHIRKLPTSDEAVRLEFAEIEASIREEREVRAELGVKEAFLGKGNFIRFVIAFVIFVLQQWAGQNSVGYYAPRIFQAIGYTGTSKSLLASGIYGIVKVVSTAIFILWGIDRFGRKISLTVSAFGMGTLFFIIGAILKTHPTTATTVVGDAQRAMAAMLYIYVCFYSFGWGPTPWIYVSDIFPTRTRHYGLAVASSSQWLFNFVVAKVTPTLETKLGYKLFFMFATINVSAIVVFSSFTALMYANDNDRSEECSSSPSSSPKPKAVHSKRWISSSGPFRRRNVKWMLLKLNWVSFFFHFPTFGCSFGETLADMILRSWSRFAPPNKRKSI
jgi:hypothetical protein